MRKTELEEIRAPGQGVWNQAGSPVFGLSSCGAGLLLRFGRWVGGGATRPVWAVSGWSCYETSLCPWPGAGRDPICTGREIGAGAATDGRVMWLVLRLGGWTVEETREEK